MITVQLKTNKTQWNPGLLFDVDMDDISNLIFDYSGELGSDTIGTATVTASNITAGTPSISGNRVTIEISGGKAGTTAKLELKIVTAGGLQMSNPIRIRVYDYYEDL